MKEVTPLDLASRSGNSELLDSQLTQMLLLRVISQEQDLMLTHSSRIAGRQAIEMDSRTNPLWVLFLKNWQEEGMKRGLSLWGKERARLKWQGQRKLRHRDTQLICEFNNPDLNPFDWINEDETSIITTHSYQNISFIVIWLLKIQIMS